ncbi:hypothetical protein K1T71_006407 [Dendrolimus kikuchii]|uniref:Uncharacterized protein n=1 Tax=Dendrolimus kikuchii TaxID=765133 RepID=A0ACC1D1D2_9NEOP|nr:hypothetical protein K1T71_006407 [Dendrolimus kikuchii]
MRRTNSQNMLLWNGWYSIGLLGILSTAILAMGIDMFGFSVILTGATCDFKLDMVQTSILLSMPFVGPIVMAYPWGYISDTQGRKISLLVGLWVSFVATIISAFSPHWILMAILKFISTSFCSCAQSAAYTMLGECITEKVRDPFMLVMSSVLDFSLAIYIVISYFILNMDFAIDLDIITFAPWRLLTIVLGLPLGLAAFGMHFFYESPKFMLNAGRHAEAIDSLRAIWRSNGGAKGKYPVNRVFLDEEGNTRCKELPLLQSLWEQILPLFRPPLLKRSLQLYFITAIIFSTNNSYFMWFPYLAGKFVSSLSSMSGDGETDSLCNVINSGANVTGDVTCSSHMEISLVWTSLAQGTSFVVVLLGITKLAHRKRTLMFVILLSSSVCATVAVLVNNMITSFVMFFGLLINELCVAFIFSYFVDFYPTSYRGMAACIGVMVARGSALGGVNLLGAYILSKCSATFYTCSVLNFGAALITLTLPPDKPRISLSDNRS